MGTEFVQNQLTATQASKSDLEKSMNRWMKMVKYCYCMQAKIKHAHSFYLGIDDFAKYGALYKAMNLTVPTHKAS